MVKKTMFFVTSLILAVGLLYSFEGLAEPKKPKPKMTPMCMQCHKPAENMLYGSLEGVSGKAQTIQIRTGPATWIVRWDDNTKLIGEERFGKIPRDREIAIAITEKEGVLFAQSVSVKQPAKVPEEKLIRVGELAKLVEMGPEKGNFVLADSRPAMRYHEGHVPGAISIFDGEFDKHIGKLPKEKDKLLIFYCAGVL